MDPWKKLDQYWWNWYRNARNIIHFLNLLVTKWSQYALGINEAMPQFSPSYLFLPHVYLLKTTQLAKSNRQSPWIFFSNRQQKKRQRYVLNVNFQIPEVTCHESSNKKIAKGKTTVFTNILTEIYCWHDHWKWERFFVNKEFHMVYWKMHLATMVTSVWTYTSRRF